MKKRNQLLALCALAILVLTVFACENPFIPGKYKEPSPPQAPSISIEASPISPYVKGEGVTVTAKASVGDGGTLSYQWYSNTKNSSSGGKAVSGATGESYRPSTNIEDLYDTTYYYVQVTNTLNGKTTTAASRTVDVTVFDTEGRTPIREVTLTVMPPVKDGIPAALEGVTSTGSGYTVQSVSWNPPHSTFQSGGKYTIWVMLTADEDYTFIALRTATINGQAAAVDSNQGSTLYLTYEFKQVDVRVVTGIAIKTQPNEMTYGHEDTLRLQGLVVTLTYDSGDPEDVALANFASRIITTNPAHGITLSHTGHNNTPIVVSCNGYTVNTSPLIVNKAQITAAFVGIDSPAKENIPVTVATVASSDGFTAGAVSWSPTHNPFQGNINYTATVTLTAKADYEFASGMTAHINSSPVAPEDITSNPNGTRTLTFEFDKTLSGTVLGISVTYQPTKLSYTHGDILDLSGLVVTVQIENSADEVLTFSNASLFQTIPANGSVLRHSAYDNIPVTVNYSGHSAHTSNLTVSRKALTLDTTAASHTKVYDGTTTADNIGGIALAGIVGNENVYIVQGQTNGVYTSADAGTKTVNITSVILDGSAAGNYTVTYENNVTLTGTGNVGITKANVTVTTWPTASTVNYGQTLSSSTLTPTNGSGTGVNGAAVPGTFEWTNSGTVPSSGGNYSITFIPTSGNYNTATGNVRVNLSFPSGSQMVFTYVRGTNGGFWVGRRPGSGSADALPGAYVGRISSFNLSAYEVTQEQYQMVTGTNPSYFQGTSFPPTTGEVQGKRPVENVTWFDAVEFCNRLSTNENLTPVYTITGRTPSSGYPITAATVTANRNNNGYRLPTEAEFEYLAKGGPQVESSDDDYQYVSTNTSGSAAGNYAWISSNSSERTHQVGLKPVYLGGIYDIAGNVQEWCWDWYATAYSGSNTSVDHMGPSSGTERTFRGGSWNSSIPRSFTRNYMAPSIRNNQTGFRIVRDAQNGFN